MFPYASLLGTLRTGLLLALLSSFGSASAEEGAGAYIPIEGGELYYEVHGDDAAEEAVILLHGGFVAHGSWARQIPALSRHFKVIAVDTRGHGVSTGVRAETPLGYEQFAEDVVTLIDALDLGKAHIVGWSDGGNTGLVMAMFHPEKTASVTVIGSSHNISSYSEAGWEDMHALLGALQAGDALWVQGQQALYEANNPDPHWDLYVDQMEVMWTTSPQYSDEQVASIDIPVFVAAADNDAFYRPGYFEELAALLPNSTYRLFPDTTHSLPLEKPHALNAAIITFVNGLKR